MKARPTLLALLATSPLAPSATAAELTVSATNPLDLARASETLELTAAQLEPLGATELNTIHVRDAAGTELVCQAVDTDGDAYRRADIVVFQADFDAGETKTFTVSAGDKQIFTKDQFKAFGRFNRERFDDFAWENDRIAHRTYGAALETWEGEPLTSSTIDIWSKRTPRMVINDWYLSDDYHDDRGEGADLYSAGPTRGCGGNGLWSSERLWTSRNFVDSRVLANGPIRVLFELEYEPFRVDGIAVSETKRVSLDAGSQLNHVRSTYKQFTRPGQQRELVIGVGLKKVPGEELAAEPDEGWLLKWEAVAKNGGNQGLAVIVDPGSLVEHTEDELNQLALARVPEDGAVDYWTGFAWDKAGHIADLAAWKEYVAAFAEARRSPLRVTVSAR